MSGSVQKLVADGNLAAANVVSTRKGKTCHRIVLWKGAGRPASVDAGCVGISHDEIVSSLALAGTRVLWVDYDFGNHAYCTLLTATLSRPRARDTGFCQPDDADTFVAGLAGDKDLLVFNSWFDFGQQGNVTDVELRRMVGTRTRKLRSGPTARTVTSVDSGLIAIRGGARAVTVVRSEGSLVHRFDVKAQTAKLNGPKSVVIRTGATLTPWDLSSAVDGTPRRMKGGDVARFEDVQSGIAVYLVKKAVHLLRLSGGRDVVIRRASAGPVYAQLEAAGLFWSHGSRLEFVPMPAVRAALG